MCFVVEDIRYTCCTLHYFYLVLTVATYHLAPIDMSGVASDHSSSSSGYFTRPYELRHASRVGAFNGQTSGQCAGYAQANLCILPKEVAFDFLLFATRNPKPCPLLAVLEAGEYNMKGTDIDIRTDVPLYRVFVDGELHKETESVKDIWKDDFVTFVIGCSFSFEEALISAGVGIRHIEEVKLKYTNDILCIHSGIIANIFSNLFSISLVLQSMIIEAKCSYV